MWRLFPLPAVECVPPEIYDELAPVAAPVGRPVTAINMVTSVDGKATLHGGAATLGSALDRYLMRAIRAAHDAVLVGATTLRAEPVDPRVGARWHAARASRGRPAEPLAVVLSASGDVPLARKYFSWPNVRRVVIVGRDSPLERRTAIARVADVLQAPTPTAEPAWVGQVLFARYGVRRLLIEGGPTVNGAFVAAGLVDELFWTLAPTLVGGGERLTMLGGPPLDQPARMALVSAYLHDDEWFLRYRMLPAVPVAGEPRG